MRVGKASGEKIGSANLDWTPAWRVAHSQVRTPVDIMVSFSVRNLLWARVYRRARRSRLGGT